MSSLLIFSSRQWVRCALRPGVAMLSSRRCLSSKSVLVTGGSKGIGEAVSRRLASEGYHVTIADVDDVAGNAVAEDIGGVYLPTNMTVAAEVKAAVDDVVRRHGTLDALVNNAGVVGANAPIGDYDLDEWHRVLDVNLNGVFYAMRYGLGQMGLQETGGRVVNVTSVSGFRGLCGMGSYCASKFALRGLTQMAAVEYAKKNITVNAIAPAAVETEMVKLGLAMAPDPEKAGEGLRAMHAIPGFIQPSDIGAAAAFLLSDDARFITGHTLPVDAGALCRIANAPDPAQV